MINSVRQPVRTASRVWRRPLSLSKLVGKSTEDGRQSYSVSRRFSQPAGLVYRVVAGVEEYSAFIPYCQRSFVNKRDAKGQPTEGGMAVGFNGFDEEFTCTLQCKEPQLVVAKSISKNLFKSLETEWTIAAVGEQQCQVSLRLRYEFHSVLYNEVSRMFATKLANTMTKSFAERAYEMSRAEKR